MGAGGKPEPKAAPDAGLRYTDATPDAMVAHAKAAAMQPGAAPADVLAAIAVLGEIADRAADGDARRSLEAIGRSERVDKDVAQEAALVARMLAPDLGLPTGEAKDRELGVLTHVALAGPFRDTGGGLARAEGPEAAGERFGDPAQSWSWGTVDVRWRSVPPTFATADGVPLDLFVAPRSESCTYVASRVTLPSAQKIVIRGAASGQLRLAFDGALVGQSEDVHAEAIFDRVAGTVDATAGAHLVMAKVCSAALDDDGRVRLRITAPGGAAIAGLADSADLSGAPASSKAKPTKIATPLEKGLAAKGLAPILLRTLAGADDLKSPRAPGMLDAFVRAAPSPDALAMAAWVSPSGANRSGWLGQARDAAEKKGDAKTLAFVERRLVANHLASRMTDWAWASAQRVLAKDTDAEAVLVRATILNTLGTDALRLRAMRELAALVDAAPDKAPSAAVRQLAEIAHAYDPARELSAREILARRGERGAPLVAAYAQKDAQAAVDAARRAMEGGIADADEGVQVAETLAGTGHHQEAAALFRALCDWAPNRAGPWAGLADELSGLRSGPALARAQQGIVMALRRARELEPGEARYRAALALRVPAGSGPATARDDEKYLVSSQTILARRQGVPEKPEVGDRELHWTRAVVMHPDRRVSQLIHYAREIVIAPRTQEELVEEVPAEGDTTEILRARVHRKDGGTAFPLEERSDGARPRIRWPELAPGDVVEVAIRTWTERPVGGRGDPPFYFLDYSGATSTHPLIFNEVAVEAPPEHPIHVDVLHAAPGSFKREEKDENGRHVVRLVWEKPIIVPEEPLSPHMSEIVPLVVGSTFHGWGDFRAWYAEAVKGFTEPDDQVKRLAAELTKGKTTRDAKLKALFDFVADDIRYVNYVSGEYWLPNRPQQLLARREGDCDDKALLLITLLRAVGIEAQEVMVQTRETGQPSVLLAKNAAVPMFDHGIAFLPGPGGGTYLDATSPQSRLGPLPAMDARAYALRLDSGPAEVVQLPSSSPTDHGSKVDWSIKLAPDGSGDLTGDERHTGDSAFWLRTYMTEADARPQYVEDALVGGWFSGLDVGKKVEFLGDMAGGQAKVGYGAHSDNFARIERGELVVPLAQSSTLTSLLAPLTRRTLPVVLPPHLAPSQQVRTMRITAPAGFEWGDLPPGGEESGGEFGRAKLEVSRDARDPRTLVVRRTVVIDQHQIPVEKYAAWRAFLQRMDALLHRSVRAVPAAKQPARGAK
jgi:hypothetical protein